MMDVQNALEFTLSNLPRNVKAAVRLFVSKLTPRTPFSYDPIYEIAARFPSDKDGAESSARDELQRIADGPFGKQHRQMQGDESILFRRRKAKRSGRLEFCPDSTWVEHGGNELDGAGCFIKVWPGDPDVHWHSQYHYDPVLAALEKVRADGTRYLTTELVRIALGIQDSPGVNGRAKAKQRLKRDPDYEHIGRDPVTGEEIWINIRSAPPPTRGRIATDVGRRLYHAMIAEVIRASRTSHPEAVVNAYQRFADECDFDILVSISQVIRSAISIREKAELRMKEEAV